MFGLTDSVISWAYILNFLSVALCVVYGIVNWNKGGALLPGELEEEKEWAKEEEKIDKEFE